METVHKRKYLVLIVTLVGALVLASLIRGLALRSLLSDLLLTLALLAVFLTVFKGRFERNMVLAATLVTIGVAWTHHVVPHDYHLVQGVVHNALQTLFLGFAAAVILSNVLKEKQVTGDEVLGAVCGYLLAGMAWANVYALTELVSPGSFSMSHGFAEDLPDWHARAAVFNYFSLVTLTTMGYGDITPARPPATIFVTLEAVFGQFYIAVLVAQLVGLRLARALQPDDGRS